MIADEALVRSSFVDVLRARCEGEPARTAFVFEGDDGTARLTYAELDERARSVAAAVEVIGGSGERVLLLYPPGLDYVAALFGCLYAGAVAVPAYPPDPARLERTLPRLVAILRDARAAVVLTTNPIRAMLEERLGGGAGGREVRCVATESELEPPRHSWQPPPRGPDDLALLQYTSGSTAAPRGVLLTHGNLLQNSDFIRRAFGHSDRSCGVIWLPPYHDMGLVGGVLQPVYAGFPCVLMAPLTFLRRPVRWLRAVSEHRATGSGGPNFAFDLCVRRVDARQRAGLDLSSWDVAFNGSEPIRRETIDAFSEHFAPCGFRREAFYPCYGLAEATLMVTGGPKMRPVPIRHLDAAKLAEGSVATAPAEGPRAKSIVGCGRPDRDHRVTIADPVARTRLPEGRVGEVWVAGPSVGAGYWERAETGATFEARLADTREGPFLRTGDLGFVLEGELFVTGRIKELLVVDGRNHYPADIELACEKAAASLRPGCGAAFAYERGGRNRIGIVYEVADDPSQDHDATILAIRRAVAQAIDAQVHAVVLTRARTVPKTSSGKVQRRVCRSLFIDGKLDAVAAWSLDHRSARATAG
jgi:acyl-CoA synthetase (AMP-forming)/AMP-acid ligase II